MCLSCRQKIHRYGETLEDPDYQGPTAKPRPPLPQLVQFEPHRDTCIICTRPTKAGRPTRKREVPALEETGHHKQPKIGDDEPSTSRDNATRQLTFEVDRQANIHSVVLNSIPLEQFPEETLALVATFKCSLCDGVPYNAVQPSGLIDCQHIFCCECLTDWCDVQSVCPECYIPITDDDIKPISGIVAKTFAQLKVQCEHRDRGCNDAFFIHEIQQHSKTCIAKDKPVSRAKSSHAVKKLLNNVDRFYALNVRLKDVDQAIDQFCVSNFEEKEDVLFFLLKELLRAKFDPRIDVVHKTWVGMSEVLPS
jgi:hypothetical protein